MTKAIIQQQLRWSWRLKIGSIVVRSSEMVHVEHRAVGHMNQRHLSYYSVFWQISTGKSTMARLFKCRWSSLNVITTSTMNFQPFLRAHRVLDAKLLDRVQFFENLQLVLIVVMKASKDSRCLVVRTVSDKAVP